MNRKIFSFILLTVMILGGSRVHSQFINRGKDFLMPADFNSPVRQQLWELTGDAPFIEVKNTFKISLSYNYSSAEKYFDTEGSATEVKMSFFQYNKANDQGGYFRKHGAILTGEYHFSKNNKIILRLPFTFTEMKSYSSTTDVKPQPEFIKPRGPFQDAEITYTRKISLLKSLSFFAGAGVTLPTSRPKRYLDNPHGGYGNRFTNNLTAYLSAEYQKFRFTAGAKYVIIYPITAELFTPRPYGIGFPFLYDTTQITSDEMNSFIEANPFETGIKLANHLIFDFAADYTAKFGLNAALHFQYFKGSGDKFDSDIPYSFSKVNGNITPTEFISGLDGGSSGVIRIYLKQDFYKSKFSFTLGYGISVFGKNSQGEANLIMGLTGRF
jgi:hypothetical protein